jgi:hypothetical protein
VAFGDRAIDAGRAGGSGGGGEGSGEVGISPLKPRRA